MQGEIICHFSNINVHLPSAWYQEELKNNFRNLRPKMIDNPHGFLTITKVITSIMAGMVNGTSLEGKIGVTDNFSNNSKTFSIKLQSMCLVETFYD